MPRRPHLAVLDIGKSNSKLSVLDPATGAELFAVRRPNRAVPGDGSPQLDVSGIEHWLLDALSRIPDRNAVGALVPVAHGAACVLLDADGAVVSAPDYEDPAFEDAAAAYAPERDPFPATLSPALPLGLNLGRQLFHLQNTRPDRFALVRHLLPYPQYWAWRLSGIMAAELTSLGCHTDLWLPAANRFSGLAVRRGWDRLLPPLRPAADRLGPLAPVVAARTGLPPDCQVLCGIHDSNASFLRHRAGRAPGEPFCVVSSGTWTVLMAAGTDPARLDPARDMLGNLDAFGALVGTARFMGGREYAAICGPDAVDVPPTAAALDTVLDCGALALPGFAPAGPFPNRPGRLVGAERLDPPARAALATAYLALLTDHALDALGAAGEVMVEGPLAANPLFPSLLSALRADAGRGPVLLGDGSSGTAGGALLLLDPDRRPPPATPVPPAPFPALLAYRDLWRSRVET